MLLFSKVTDTAQLLACAAFRRLFLIHMYYFFFMLFFLVNFLIVEKFKHTRVKWTIERTPEHPPLGSMIMCHSGFIQLPICFLEWFCLSLNLCLKKAGTTITWIKRNSWGHLGLQHTRNLPYNFLIEKSGGKGESKELREPCQQLQVCRITSARKINSASLAMDSWLTQTSWRL